MRYAIQFLSFAIGAFLLAAIYGMIVPASYSETLDSATAAESISFVFGVETGGPLELTVAEGSIHHGPLTRRSFIHGATTEGEYAEQVLKVGWPFTVARAFIHVTPEGRRTIGVLGSAAEGELPAEGIIPVQPVWPGVIFWGLIGVLLAAVPTFRR